MADIDGWYRLAAAVVKETTDPKELGEWRRWAAQRANTRAFYGAVRLAHRPGHMEREIVKRDAERQKQKRPR